MSPAKRILIIDDDPDILTYLSEILRDHAYDIVTAGDGAAGLKKACEVRPNLILLDLMMPRMSGVQFLNEIKQDASLKDVPVIVVSAATKVTGVDMKQYLKEQPFKDRKGKALGHAADITPDAYLDKSADPAVLIETVERLIGT